jgi:hypothetical protein
MDGDGANQGPSGRSKDPGSLSFGAGVLEELGVIDSGRTGGHAGEATEAIIHFFAECWRHLHPAIGYGSHE